MPVLVEVVLKLRGGAEILVADKLELEATLPRAEKVFARVKKQIERKGKRYQVVILCIWTGPIISLTRTGITGAPSFVKMSSELGIQPLTSSPGFSSVDRHHKLLINNS